MSIHARLMRLLVWALLPLVVVSLLIVYLLFRASLMESVDDGLLARARTLSASVKLEPEGVELDATPGLLTHYADPAGHEFFEVWRLDGGREPSLQFRSDSLGDRRLGPGTWEGEHSAWSGGVERGPSVRGASLRFTIERQPPDEEDRPAPAAAQVDQPESVAMLIVVARDAAELRSTLATLAAALALAGAFLVLGTVLVVRASLGRGLQPIQRLADEVAAIAPDDPAGRVGATGLPAELAPLARRTNQLLDRVGVAIERERRLAASAAHELRTPIAEIQAASEVALERERSPAEYRRALGAVLEVAQRMGESAAAVLRLARIQSGREPARVAPTRLLDAVTPAWTRWVRPLAARDIRASLDVSRELLVRGDAAMLGVAFSNLCSNIAEHTPSGGEVRLDAGPAGDGRVRVRIANSVTPPSAEREDAATREMSKSDNSTPHLGLGLRTAEQMVRACGGSMHAGVAQGRFEVSIELPSAIEGVRGTGPA